MFKKYPYGIRVKVEEITVLDDTWYQVFYRIHSLFDRFDFVGWIKMARFPTLDEATKTATNYYNWLVAEEKSRREFKMQKRIKKTVFELP